MNRSSVLARMILCLCVVSPSGFAPDLSAEDAAPAITPAVPVVNITDKWTVLVKPDRPRPGIVEFTDKSPIQNVAEFKLLGPMVSHPFGLGEFTVDGRWATAQGVVQVVEGKNALLSLATADEFELEGIINQEGMGGWLMLLGWNQGHGYSLSNFTLKDTGHPWSLCEYRASEAIAVSNNTVKKFDWKGDQPFRMTVQDKQLTVTVGQTAIVEAYPLDNYTPGQVCLGTYDTRYGARPVKIRSLRIRAVVEQPEQPEKPKPKPKPKQAAPPPKKGAAPAKPAVP